MKRSYKGHNRKFINKKSRSSKPRVNQNIITKLRYKTPKSWEMLNRKNKGNRKHLGNKKARLRSNIKWLNYNRLQAKNENNNINTPNPGVYSKKKYVNPVARNRPLFKKARGRNYKYLIDKSIYLANAFDKVNQFIKTYLPESENFKQEFNDAKPSNINPIQSIDISLGKYSDVLDTTNNNQDNFKPFSKVWRNLSILNKINNINIKYKGLIIRKVFSLEKKYLAYVTYLEFNNSLFKNWFINPLINLISRIYNKKVVFNIVSLKNMFLNSDILSHLISVRLRNNRKNNNNRVFRRLFSTIALARVNEFAFNKHSKIYLYLNKHNMAYNNLHKKLNIYKPSNKKNIKSNLNENISPISLNKFNDVKFIVNERELSKPWPEYKNNNLNSLTIPMKNTINIIKHKSIFGLKVQTSGRLTKRVTASRAVFKFAYLGNLKLNPAFNIIDSSVLMKNNISDNIQFTKTSSKTRNGAFGVKLWINQA